MVISEAKVSSKRQITLPIKIMKKLGISPGDSLAFDEIGKDFIIRPKTKKISALDIHKHFAHLSKKKVSQEQINKAREDAWSSRHRNTSTQ